MSTYLRARGPTLLGASHGVAIDSTMPGHAFRSSVVGFVVQRIAAGIVIVVAVAASTIPLAVAPSAGAEPCHDVEVVFARGTFEPPGVGVTGQAFVDALTTRLGTKTVEVYPVNYPASLDFARAGDGVADSSDEIMTMAESCPRAKIVLGGYSQGAAVAAYTTADTVPSGYPLPEGITGPMPAATANHVAAVVLFGTPSNGFLNLVKRDAPPIAIGALYEAKTLELCAPEDPVCSATGGDRSAHSAYRSNGMTDQGADFAAQAISQRA